MLYYVESRCVYVCVYVRTRVREREREREWYTKRRSWVVCGEEKLVAADVSSTNAAPGLGPTLRGG